MAWLENGELISDSECGKLISKGYQFVEGVLLPPDKVNDLIRSGYTTPHLANGLQYTLTSKEAKSLGLLSVGVLGGSLVLWGAWNLGKFTKSKFNNRKKENL